jgi:hypothetical protein
MRRVHGEAPVKEALAIIGERHSEPGSLGQPRPHSPGGSWTRQGRARASGAPRRFSPGDRDLNLRSVHGCSRRAHLS